MNINIQYNINTLHNKIFHTLKKKKHLKKITQINNKLSYYKKNNNK